VLPALKKPEKNNKKAFSLIELFIVFTLIFLTLSISIPNIGFFEKQTLKRETQKLFSVLEFLRKKAIATNKNQSLILDIEQNKYTYKRTKNGFAQNKLSTNIIFGFLENIKGPPSSPKKIIKKATTFPKIKDSVAKYIITFFNDGKISCGTLYLTNKKKTFMKAITCPISQVSLIRKYQLVENSKWALQ
jgi:competence protein ComGC